MTWRFFAVTPGDGRPLFPWIEALAPRVTDLVLREPDASRAVLEADARAALSEGLNLWIHTRNAHARGLAEQLGCGLHVPASAPSPGYRHGRSCHTGPELDAAFAGGATYAFLSPVFSPTSKPSDSREPLGTERFLALSAGRSVIALGGVDAVRAHTLRDRGAWGVAVLGGLFGCDRSELPTTLERYPAGDSGPSMMKSSES